MLPKMINPPSFRFQCFLVVLKLNGYFPTYTLGNLYAAQLYDSAVRDIPDLNEQISRGELMPLKSWLNAKVHQQGSRLQAGELVREVAGKGLEIGPFVSYLNEKFGGLYGLDL